MMRRFNHAVTASQARKTMTGRVAAPTSSGSAALAVGGGRQFHSLMSLFGSCITCAACMLCGGSWANNFCNVSKYGRWRFRNSIDDVIMVSDFKGARFVGAGIGLLFWWFVVGPQKYRWASNLEEVPGNTRVGPF